MTTKPFKESKYSELAAKIEGKEPQRIHITDDGHGTKISLWTCSFWERVKFLFHGNIWIGIMHPNKLPPFWIDCKKTVFIDETKIEK